MNRFLGQSFVADIADGESAYCIFVGLYIHERACNFANIALKLFFNRRHAKIMSERTSKLGNVSTAASFAVALHACAAVPANGSSYLAFSTFS